MMEGKWAIVLFKETDGGIDFASERLQSIRRARRRKRDDCWGGDAINERRAWGVLGGRRHQTGEDGLFEKFVGVNFNGMVARGYRGESVLTKIEARLRHGQIGFPVGSPKIPIIAFVRFLAGGNKTKVLGPAEGQVVMSKLRGIAKVGIPAFA